MTIGWGIIGAGNHANQVMGPALNKVTNTKIVAACDINMERAEVFKTEHGAARAYETFEEMLGDPKLDVVYVATPNSLHAQHTIQTAEAGKHVLCEKPMALTVLDCEHMIQTCNKNHVKLGVCFQNRYHPAHIEARRYIQSGVVGQINVAKAQYCRSFFSMKGWRSNPIIAGAGALMGQGIHCIDLLRYLLDSEVTEVRALTDEEPPRRPIDEMVYAILKFENGVTGIIVSGILAPRSDNDAVLYGSRAKLTCHGTVGRPVQGLGELLVDGDNFNTRMSFPTDDPLLFRNIRLIEAFHQWIENDVEPCISGPNGLQMVRITNAIIESSHQGKAKNITS